MITSKTEYTAVCEGCGKTEKVTHASELPKDWLISTNSNNSALRFIDETGKIIIELKTNSTYCCAACITMQVKDKVDTNPWKKA